MPRGERGAPGGGAPALVLWSVFGVLCLAAATLVAWTSGLIEEVTPLLGAGGGHTVAHPIEPFSGARAALAPLGWRDCAPTAPPGGAAAGATTADRAAAFDTRLQERGYEPLGPWSAPHTLPATVRQPALEGSCGVVAVAARPGGWITAIGPEAHQTAGRRPCDGAIAAYPSCGAARIEVRGSGPVRVRAYGWPGLVPPADGAPEAEIPLDVRLAHLEAAALLARRGWSASDSVVRLAPEVSGGSAEVTPPATPPSGCVPWVAVGEGLGHATTRWNGMRQDDDGAARRFMLGAVSCAPSGGAPAKSEIEATVVAGESPRVWLRPYAATTGPSVGPAPGDRAAATTGMRRVDADALELPPSVPGVTPGAP